MLDHKPTCELRCVNPAHLRVATQKQNLENLRGARRRSKTGVRGVFWIESLGRYRAEVRHWGICHHVGCFDSINEAESAVIAKRLELFTHNDVDRSRAC